MFVTPVCHRPTSLVDAKCDTLQSPCAADPLQSESGWISYFYLMLVIHTNDLTQCEYSNDAIPLDGRHIVRPCVHVPPR